MNAAWILLFLLMSTMASCSPQPPLDSLLRLYPDAKDISWNIDRNGNMEANYSINGVKYRSDFNPLTGEWIETERSIKWKDLPKAVTESVLKHADRSQIVELEEVHSRTKGFFYDVEVRKKGKGKRDLVIAKDGTIIDIEEWK